MNNKKVIGNGKVREAQRKKYLNNKLKRYVYDQKEMDVEEVKEIVKKLNEIEPEEPLSKAEKDDMWKNIQAMAQAETSKETAAETAPVVDEVSENQDLVAGKKERKHRRNFYRRAVEAAAVIAAVFVGANIGTYATARMNVFQYMGEVKNGTSFWVSGDKPAMEKEKAYDTYYSWNDVPNEYKKYLIIPQNIPEKLSLYSIQMISKETVDWIQACYLDDNAKKSLDFEIGINQNEEFTFRNLMYEEGFEFQGNSSVKGIEVNYYVYEKEDVFAQFVNGERYYTFSGNMDLEVMKSIVEETIKYNF